VVGDLTHAVVTHDLHAAEFRARVVRDARDPGAWEPPARRPEPIPIRQARLPRDGIVLGLFLRMLIWMDTGLPISYQVLREGTPVCSSDGVRIGAVAHVLAVEDEDVFDGVVINELSRDHVPEGSEHRFVDASAIDSIHERAVTLKLSAADCRELPEPSANPAVMRDDPADGGASELGSKLRRAWDRLSGRY
jgi:hypothetical protein